MRRIGLIGVTAVAAVTLAACTGNATSTVRPAANASHSAKAAASATPSPAGPVVTITPATGDTKADPSKGLAVTASGGTLKNVAVHTTGDPVTGSYSGGNTAWHSTWALDVSTSYTVTATATAKNGATTTKTGLKVRAELDTNKYPKGTVVPDTQLDAVSLTRHNFHGDWNYTIAPVA